MEVTFNFLEIRAMNTYQEHQVPEPLALSSFFPTPLKCLVLKCAVVHLQVVIDTDKTTYSLRLQTQDQLDHMVSHINYALSRVFNNSIYA